MGKYESAHSIAPDDAEVLLNWACTLVEMAQRTEDDESEDLFHRAEAKYGEAHDRRPTEPLILVGWGTDLFLRSRKRGVDTGNLLEEAQRKYNRALVIAPDDPDTLNGLGVVMMARTSMMIGTACQKLLAQAEAALKRSAELRPWPALYNLALLYAKEGDEGRCREALEGCRRQGFLPSKDELLREEDLRSVRDHAWFQALLQVP